jgi:hypothetical protein
MEFKVYRDNKLYEIKLNEKNTIDDNMKIIVDTLKYPLRSKNELLLFLREPQEDISGCGYLKTVLPHLKYLCNNTWDIIWEPGLWENIRSIFAHEFNYVNSSHASISESERFYQQRNIRMYEQRKSKTQNKSQNKAQNKNDASTQTE